jgi:hypothetical protein
MTERLTPTANDLIGWPAQMLPALPVLVRPYKHLGEGVLAPNGPLEARRHDEELYLRELMTLDLEDADEIADFCGKFGVLRHSATRDTPRMMREIPIEEDDPEGMLALLAYASTVKAQDAVRVLLGDDYPLLHSVLHVVDFCALAHELRDMTRVLLGLNEVESHTEDDFEAVHYATKDSLAARFTWYRGRVSLGLRDYAPRLEDSRPEAPLLFADSMTATEREGTLYPTAPVHGTPRWLPTSTLYNQICRQHYNAIVRPPTFHVCHRASCEQVFVQQRGRAKAGQHRTKSVNYCSTRCANAEAQRKWRANNPKPTARKGVSNA